MIFNQAAKNDLLASMDADRAFVAALDPSVDTAPLEARILELEAEVGVLSGKLVATREALALAVAAAA